MAIYCYPNANRRPYVDEVGCDIRVTSGPKMSAPADFSGGVLLYFWALGCTFVNSSQVEVGSGHIGLQAYNHYALDYKGLINWGVYDSTIGPTAVCRSGPQLTADMFIDLNVGTSFGFTWFYNHWYRFRVFKSPKQDYVANEISDGQLQVAPYIGTDQQADEVAYRCTVQDLTAGSVPWEIHDVLVKQTPTTGALLYDSFFTEPIQDGGWGGASVITAWPWSPEVHFRQLDHDGTGNSIDSHLCNYGAGTSNCNITAVNGTPGYMRHKGNETRTTAHGTDLALPTGFYDTPPANVTPNIHDVSARVATRRPWY